MTVTLTAEVTVETRDLRNALRAVVPHAEPNKTGDLDLKRRDGWRHGWLRRLGLAGQLASAG